MCVCVRVQGEGGWNEGKKKGRKDVRKGCQGRKEGRKEGRKAQRKEQRKVEEGGERKMGGCTEVGGQPFLPSFFPSFLLPFLSHLLFLFRTLPCPSSLPSSLPFLPLIFLPSPSFRSEQESMKGREEGREEYQGKEGES